MKKILVVIAVVAGMVFIVPPLLPASVGQQLYAGLTDLEANLSGFEQRSVDIGELSLSYYRNDNQGKPAVVMLHGYSANKDAWIRFARHISDDYDIIIPDMAGHGDTGFNPSWNYGGRAQAGRIAKMLTQLDIEGAHLVGNSMGGFISAHFAIAYPQRTLSVAMFDPAGVSSPQPSKMQQLLSQGRNVFIVNNREEFDEFFAMTMAQAPWFPDIILDAVAEQYVQRQSELKQIFADFHGKEMLDAELHKIQAPALLLWGEKDQLIHVSSVDVWRNGVSALTTHVWPNVGHMPMMEIPAQSAQRYADFLNTVK